jgi:4-hydroxy-tetrahydrodipicolinate reductase
MKIGVHGASGRMGRAVLKTTLDRKLSVGAVFESETSPFLGKDAGELLFLPPLGVFISVLSGDSVADCDVIVDFSSPSAVPRLLDIAVAEKKPLVICTTGIDEAGRRKIEEASRLIPVVYSPNMSVGVNLMFKLIEKAALTLPEGYDIEVFEAHHRMKKDAPSGTARKLIDIIKEAIPRLGRGKEVYAREGITGERTDDEIGVQVMRGGDIVGEHTVYFISPEERIEITHRASSRDVFAKGAVRAAEYLAGKAPGIYTMYDVLGL